MDFDEDGVVDDGYVEAIKWLYSELRPIINEELNRAENASHEAEDVSRKIYNSYNEDHHERKNMKDKIKKFWKDNRNDIETYLLFTATTAAAGFISGYILAKDISRGYHILSADELGQRNGRDILRVNFKNGTHQYLMKRLD